MPNFYIMRIPHILVMANGVSREEFSELRESVTKLRVRMGIVETLIKELNTNYNDHLEKTVNARMASRDFRYKVYLSLVGIVPAVVILLVTKLMS